METRSKHNNKAAPGPWCTNPAHQRIPVSRLGSLVYTKATSPETGGMRYWRCTGPLIPLRGSTRVCATMLVVACSQVYPVCQGSSWHDPVSCQLVVALQLNDHVSSVLQAARTEESLERMAPFNRSHPLFAVAEALLEIHSYRPPTYISRQRPGIPRPYANPRFQSKQMTPGAPTAQNTVFRDEMTARQWVFGGPRMPEAPHSALVSDQPEVQA